METVWQFDLETLRAINSHSPVLDPIFWAVTSLGLGWLQAVLILPMFAAAHLRRVAVASLISLALSSILLHICKWQFPRLRPTNLPETLYDPGERIFLGSFPSGHTTSSFAIATTVVMLWPGSRKKAGWILLPLATLIGISRVYRGVHWPTDVIAGALLGYASGAAVALFFSRKEQTE